MLAADRKWISNFTPTVVESRGFRKCAKIFSFASLFRSLWFHDDLKASLIPVEPFQLLVFFSARTAGQECPETEVGRIEIDCPVWPNIAPCCSRHACIHLTTYGAYESMAEASGPKLTTIGGTQDSCPWPASTYRSKLLSIPNDSGPVKSGAAREPSRAIGATRGTGYHLSIG